MRKREILKILAWSAYFAMLVYFIIFHPYYVDRFHDPLSEIQKVTISIIMFLIFIAVGLLVRFCECFKR